MSADVGLQWLEVLSLVLRVLCEKEVDFNGDESVDEEAAALVQRILSGMARTMTSCTLKANS